MSFEDSEVLLTEISSMEELHESIPAMGAFFQRALQKSMTLKNQRIVASMSAGAKERYTNFLNSVRHSCNAYLNISLRTWQLPLRHLSRIRKQKSSTR
jgi:hypothetical protein